MSNAAAGTALLIIGAVGIVAVIVYAVWVQVWKPRGAAASPLREAAPTQAIPLIKMLPFPLREG